MKTKTMKDDKSMEELEKYLQNKGFWLMTTDVRRQVKIIQELLTQQEQREKELIIRAYIHGFKESKHYTYPNANQYYQELKNQNKD